jgi:tetratricopeptide (TPR) repeat protein
MQSAKGEKGIVSGFFSPQAAFALLAVGVFLLTMHRPANLSIIGGGSGGSKATSDVSVNSMQILDSVASMEPSKLLAEGKTDEAIGEAKSEVKDRPYDIATLMSAGNVLAKVGDKQKGIELLKQSVALAPQSRYVALNYAARLAEIGKTDEAIQEYASLCNKFPKQWAEPHYGLGQLYILKRDATMAEQELKVVLEDLPNNNQAQRDYALAVCAKGNQEEAFAIFQKACAAPRDEQFYAQQSKAILQRSNNITKKATGELRIEMATHPKRLELKLEYLRLLLYLNRHRDAREAANDAIKAMPNNPELHVLACEASLKSNNKDAALAEFEKAAKLTYGTEAPAAKASPSL